MKIEMGIEIKINFPSPVPTFSPEALHANKFQLFRTRLTHVLVLPRLPLPYMTFQSWSAAANQQLEQRSTVLTLSRGMQLTSAITYRPQQTLRPAACNEWRTHTTSVAMH